jgi:hypothetical protein
MVFSFLIRGSKTKAIRADANNLPLDI